MLSWMLSCWNSEGEEGVYVILSTGGVRPA